MSSYQLQTNNRTDRKYIIDIKHRREICSIDGCLSKSQRNSLCTKHLKSKDKHQILPNKRSRWTGRSLPRDNSKKTSHEICSTYKHSSVSDELHRSHSLSKSDPNDDTKSENSIEYDYEYPFPPSIPQRHVSLATIYLQDKQWQQLELFIKQFSSCVSLSNNLNVNSSTTHLLVDDSIVPYQCTFSKKIFQAVARHIFIVSIRWIEQCLFHNQIIDETPFEIHGDGTISTMHLARQSSVRTIFSSSMTFLIDCHSFQRVFTRSELAELVLLTGASLYSSDERIPTKILLILVEPSADRSELEEKYKQHHRNKKFLTPGFLLKSIIYQKIQPFEDFEL